MEKISKNFKLCKLKTFFSHEQIWALVESSENIIANANKYFSERKFVNKIKRKNIFISCKHVEKRWNKF